MAPGKFCVFISIFSLTFGTLQFTPTHSVSFIFFSFSLSTQTIYYPLISYSWLINIKIIVRTPLFRGKLSMKII
jgi:hypothetical protein